MSILIRYRLGILVFGVLFVFACSKKTTPPISYEKLGFAQTKSTAPKLVVMLSVDQMRASYLDRFSELYTGGLKRLREEGLVFENAHHEHALTMTAPGHATLSTGCYPSRHGVVENNFFDQKTKKLVYSVADPTVQKVGVEHWGMSHSPAKLKIPAIGDWLKKDSRKSKVYGVALKDRSPILLAGQKPNQVYWFDDRSTRYISSSHYGQHYPEWAKTLVGRELFKSEIERGWHKKLADEAVYERLAGPDNVVQENASFLPGFPHTQKRMGGFVRPESRERAMFWTTPLGDKFSLRFAQELVKKNRLGADEFTDMLMISCSAADAIGHHFGPDSQEVMDYYLWLDEYLDTFLSFLDEQIGRDEYLVVMSADHGVVSMPEVAAKKGIDAKRITNKKFKAIMAQFDLNQQKALGLTSSIIHTASFTGLSLNYEEAKAKGITEANLRKTIAVALKKMYFVEDVFTVETLAVDNPNRPFLALYQRSAYPGRGHDIKLRYKENYLVAYGASGSTHGSPYTYDSHVPMVYFGFGMPAQRIERKVATVDIAPTLAQLMHLTVTPEVFDGLALPEVVRRRK